MIRACSVQVQFLPNQVSIKFEC